MSILRSARRLAAGLTAATALTLSSGLAAPAAHADIVDAACTGTNQDAYQPGITLLPRQVNATWQDTYSSCTSSDPTLTAGSDSDQATQALSCADPAQLFPGPFTVSWDNGMSSTLQITSVQTQLGTNTVTIAAGTVVAGEFPGDSGVLEWVDGQLNLLQCLTPQGITSQSGLSSLQITGA